MYTYAASLVRVVDGDTVVMKIDLGFTVQVTVTFRLLGINTPEMIGPNRTGGLAAKAHLEQLLGMGTLTLRSEKPLKTDKYGRYLADITVTLPDGSSFNANQRMVADGHAVVYVP